MKNFGITYIFAAIIAALVGYTVYDHKQTLKSEVAKAQAEKVISVERSAIVQIKTVLPNETMVFKLDKGQWSLSEPLVDQVEEEAATSYLEAIVVEKATPVFIEKKVDINWSNYNLEPPGAAIEITKVDGSKVSFSVSKMAAFDGSYFVRRGDELLLGSTGWGKIIDKGSAQMRSKKVFREPGEVVKLRVENFHKDNKDKFTLIRGEDMAWRIAEAPGLEIDGEKVQKYIEDIKNIRALDFQSEKPSAAARKQYSIHSPIMKVTADIPDTKSQWMIEVGAEKDAAHYGISSSIDAIFRLSVNDGEQLRRDRGYFRNGKVPFKFPMEQAGEIRVKSDAKQWTFKKDGAGWKLADVANAIANTESLQQLVEKVGSLEAKEFLVNAKGAKVTGSKQIEFRSNDGKSLLNLSFGESFTPQAGINKGTQLVYAKSSLAPETLAIAAGDLSAIPFDQLVTPAAAESPGTQSEKK